MGTPMLCANCTHENPDTARFCNQCGASVTVAVAPEFKRLTILFCDLVGSVGLASQLDPEDWYTLLGAYQLAAGDAIRRRQGHIAQHLGDGMVAYFGYPLAGEDDAARAVQAALDLVAAVAALPVRQGRPALQVRVGLHTGPVVMGDVGSGSQREYLALGDTPNIAARLQALAPANGVLVTAATQGAVKSKFRCQDLGGQSLKGIAAPIRLYKVIGPLQADGDDDPAAVGQAPLLGRARELDLLRGQWRAASTQAGNCLLLTGDPGIGKSRLARELRAHVAGNGSNVWLVRCSAHGVNTPFAPLAQLLARVIGAAPTDSREARIAALASTLASVGITDPAALAALAGMLAIELPPDPSAPPLSARALRERTFSAASRVLSAAASQRPTLLVVEDLHWCDPSTLEWLGRLLQRDISRGLMLLLTARGEFRAPWPDSGRVQQLTLEPCTPGEAAEMVRALDPARGLADEAVARIVARSEGNPLFVEEFTRSALEAGGDEIPATLHEQTLARLDRLGLTAKQVLQQAAVIGRHFGQQRLRAVCGLVDEMLALALQCSVQAHLLRPVAGDGGEAFAFRHALLQDAAYTSLLRSARQACHLRVAQALLAEDPAAGEHQPEVLAHHYAEAGQVQAAAAYFLRAGQIALSSSACMEAAAHARRALALLGDARTDEASLALELELQLVLAPALMAVHSVLDSRVEQAYMRARRLCESIGNAPKLLVPLWGLWGYELMRGRFDEARSVSGQLGALARQVSQTMPSLVAATTAGMTLFYQGDLGPARAEFAKGIALYSTPRHAARSVRAMTDPGVMCHAFDMLACWLMGETAAAHAGAARLRGMAPALAQYDAAFLWCGDALLAVLEGDTTSARASAGRAITIAQEQAFSAWQVMGSVLQGWGAAREGPAAPGIEQMQRGFDAWCATGARNLRPLFSALLADAWLAAGDTVRALEAADAGLDIAATGERCWVPELHRLRGMALAGLGERTRALECLRAAVASAEQMGAQAWRDRAVASLERIDQDPGRPT